MGCCTEESKPNCSTGSAVQSNKECHSSSASATTAPSQAILDIEELHTQAVREKSNTYIDPETGFMVFTEYSHLKRGKCCGNVCRHCPYGWENVSYKNKNGDSVSQQARVKSGDKEGIQLLLNKIDNGQYGEAGMKSMIIETNDDPRQLRNESKSESESESDSESDSEFESESESESESELEIEQTIESKTTGKGGREGGTLTAKNVPYTRTGDKGTSMLLTGERRLKDDISFEAMGTVDELCSVVGLAHAELLSNIDLSIQQKQNNIDYQELNEWLLETMSRLFDVGSHIAKPRRKCDDEDDEPIFVADGVGGGFDEAHTAALEEWIDIMTEQLPELTSFILPSGGKASAHLHLARTVCRRAERRVLPLVREGVCDPNTARYLNRLSDFFFIAARFTNFCEGKEEVQYRRYFRGAKQRNMVTIKLREEKKDPM